MDLFENFDLLQDFLINLPVFPLLWIPHCILMAMASKSTYGLQSVALAKANPLSTYIKTMIYTFPGGILHAILMGEPAFAFMANMPFMAAMTLSWYFIFYFDFIANILSKFVLPMTIAQDFFRLQLCLAGVASVASNHPSAFLYMAFMGVCKSSGFMVFKYLEHALDHGLNKAFVVPNHPSKTCVLASVAFAAQTSGLVNLGGHKLILTVLTLLVVNFRLMFAITTDPYECLEVPVCSLIFGKTHEEPRKKVMRLRELFTYVPTCHARSLFNIHIVTMFLFFQEN